MLKELETSTVASPQDRQDLILLLSKIYLRQNLFQSSMHYANILANENPNNLEAFMILGYIYQKSSQFSMAIRYYQYVLGCKPNHAQANIELQNCFTSQIQTQLNHNQALPVYAIPQEHFNTIQVTNIHNQYRMTNTPVLNEIQTGVINEVIPEENILTPNESLRSRSPLKPKAKRLKIEPTTQVLLQVPQQQVQNYQTYNLKQLQCGQQYMQPRPVQCVLQPVDIIKATQYLNEAINARIAGSYQKALELYKKAINYNPTCSRMYNELGATYQLMGLSRDAAPHYRKAIELSPTDASLYTNLGNVLKELQDFNGAVEAYTNAISLDNKSPDVFSNLGALYKDSGNHIMAIQAFECALRIDPNYADAYCNLMHSKQMICDWSNYEERLKDLNKIVLAQLENKKKLDKKILWVPSIHPHHTMLYPSLTQETALDISKCHAEMAQTKIIGLLSNPQSNIVNDKYLDFYIKNQPLKMIENGKVRKLHVGFVSSDFGNHPTAHLTRSVFGALQRRGNFIVSCYALVKPDNTLFYKQIEKECDRMIHFADTSPVNMAEIVKNDKVDILINMNGYTRGAQTELFALRPAPIQVLWLGYPGGCGTKYIDYLITDKVTTPLSLQKNYTEKFACLNRSFFIGDHAFMFNHLNNRIIINGQEKTADGQTLEGATTRTVLHTRSSVFAKIKTDVLVSLNKAVLLANNLESMCSTGQQTMQVELQGQTMTFINGSQIISIDSQAANGERCPLEDGSSKYGAAIKPPLVGYDGIVTSRIQYHLPLDKVVYCNFNQLYR